MAPRFLGKTAIDGLDLLKIEGRPVLGDYARLRDLLQTRAPAAAGLLAEPIGNWNSADAPVVSWYAEANNDPETLATLAPDHRQQLDARLRGAMAAVAPLLADPSTGPTLRLALTLCSFDGIKAVDNRIVLTDWGMVRAGTHVSSDTFGASPLGRFLPIAQTAAPSARVATPPPLPLPPPPVNPPFTPVQGGTRGVWNWWLVPAGIVVAVLFFIFGLREGARLIAERLANQPTEVQLVDEASVRDAIARQKQQNDSLEHELESRRQALSGNVCPVDPEQMPRIGPDHAATVPPAATPTPPGGQPFRGTLAQLLTQSVVMVIAAGNQVETGSGFFIAPDLIVTNRHVVENAESGKLFVSGGKLTAATRAEIVTESSSSEVGQIDIAVLRVAPVPGVQPLSMSTVATALDPVVAAGFPGLTMGGDEATTRLLNGDPTAVPTVILTDGKISAIQIEPGGLKVMPHTAAVSGGNSGGPLVDSCGRVVGVNTFITTDQQQAAHANYAQKSDALIAFFQANHISVNTADEPCAPAPQAQQAPPPAQQAPPQAPQTPSAPQQRPASQPPAAVTPPSSQPPR